MSRLLLFLAFLLPPVRAAAVPITIAAHDGRAAIHVAGLRSTAA